MNLSINTFTAITETPIAYMIENQYAWDFAEKMICEAVDVKRCIPTEIDAINGAIVEQARRYNVSVPYNSLIVDLIHAIEGAYKYRKD